MATACLHMEIQRNTGNPKWWGGVTPQPDAREGQAGPPGVAERPAVTSKPGNAGGAKGPWFKVNAISGRQPGDWREPNTSD